MNIILRLISILFLIIGVGQNLFAANYDFEDNGILYKIYSNKQNLVDIVGYNGNIPEDLIISYTKYREIGQTRYIDHNIHEIKYNAFANCTKLKTVAINSATAHLSSEVFVNCSNLTKVYLSQYSSQSLGVSENVFKGCSSIVEVHTANSSPSSLIQNNFDENVYQNAILIVPDGCSEIYRNTEGWNSFANIIEKHTLTFSVSTGGGVICNDVALTYTNNNNRVTEVTFMDGESAQLNFVPSDGYRLSKVLINGEDVTSQVVDNTYIIENVNTNMIISVSYETIPTYSLLIYNHSWGKVLYNGTTVYVQEQRSFNVREGTNAIISFVPEEDCRLKVVKLEGVDITSSIVNNQYTITNIRANVIIEVEFEQIPVYTLTIKTEGNGIAIYDGETIRDESRTFSVLEGMNADVMLSPDDLYCVQSVKLNDTDVTSKVVDNKYSIYKVSNDSTLEVIFGHITHSLTIKSIGNGTSTYGGTTIRGISNSFTIEKGNNALITFTPDKGYRIKSVKLNGTDVTSNIVNNQYTISDINCDNTLEVEFEEITYSLTITSAGNGLVSYNDTSIQGKTISFTIPYGSSATMTITPDTGYKLKSVKLNGKDVTSIVVNNQYTISNVTLDTTIEVVFEQITYSLTIKAIGNGTVTYDETTVRGKSSAFTINYGNNATISIVPDDGYRIKSVKLNETDVTSTIKNNQYTITDIKANTTLEVVFEQIPNYTISIVSEGNGKVTYGSSIIRNQSKEFTIREGNSISISFTPDSGYRLASVKVNGDNKTAQVVNNQLTIENISADMTIEVAFEVIPPTNFTLTIKATGNGSVTYNGTAIRGKSSSFTIVEGTSTIVTFTPDDGYRIKSVKLNATDITSSVKDGQYTISNINSDNTLEVEFEAITYTLSIISVGNGSATYDETTISSKTSTFTVSYGTDAVVSFTPDEGYRIKSVKVNGTDVTSKVANNQYTIANITSDTSLEVEFERITYTLSITATGSGTISYNDVTTRSKTNAFNVVESSSATLTITPDEGYRIKSLKVNSVDVTSNIKDGKYTISNISANTTIEVIFEAIPNYTISILATGNGNVGYDGAVIRNQSQSYSVREGGSITISFSPDKGYRVASVTVNKTDMTGQIVDGQLTISNISSNTSIEVVFEEIPPTTYSLTVKVGDNGSVTYDGTAIRNKSNSFTVVEGTYVTVTITPDEGYRIKSVKLNNVDITSNVKNNQYTISGIGSNTSIEVEFEEIICTLSITSIGNGSVTYDETAINSKTSTFTVSYGTDAVVSFTSDEGYRIKSVKVNGTDVTSKVANNQYTIANITSDTSLEVEFERVSYSLTIVASGNGSASYNGTTVRGKSSSFTLIEGMDAIVSFSPDAGYRLKSVKLNSKDITSSVTNLQYTISGINANTTLEVAFEAIPTYTINIVSSGNGRVTYGSVVVRNQSREFSVKEGNSISVSFSADSGCRLASVNVNNKDMIGLVVNNQLTIENITADTNIEVTFEAIPVTQYTLTVKSTGSGAASYNETAVRDTTYAFIVAKGTNVVIVITSDDGYRVKSVKLNDTDVTSSVKNNLYSVKIDANATIEVEFEADVMEFAIGNVNYKVVSYSDKTIQLASGNYGATLTVPATCTANDRQWTVIGVETDALANCTDLAAIIWNPEVQFNGNIKNPNLLLYVKDKKFAPTTVRNVVVDNVAEEITLSDAESGNPFYCPKAFTAQRIIYEHNYSMTSGYQTCQGWETLVLPFNVTTIQRQNGTEIVPRETWVQGSNKLPFWLYTLTELGWRPEITIAANTPYIISMPNNENYNSKYNISGVIQFIGTNVEVKASDNLPVEKNGNKTFVPNYQYLPASESMYALNVNNQWCTNTTTEAEGSVFVKNSRPVHPFEAYLTVSGADAAKRLIPIFEDDLPADIKNLTPSLSQGEGAMYDLTGRKVQGELKRGVYIVNGKKVMVK